jgi:hypothetical protein
MKIAITPLVLVLIVSTMPVAAAEDSVVIFDMESVRHKMTEITDAEKRKAPAGTVEAVEGNSIRLMRDDPDSEHRRLPLAWVEHVGQTVRLDRRRDAVERSW